MNSTTHLSSLTVHALRTLTKRLGLTISGTKPVLLDILSSYPTPPPRPESLRVCSIDMGIRNLAFCTITVPATTATAAGDIRIRAWERFNVTQQPVPDPETGKAPREPFNPDLYAEKAYAFLTQAVFPTKPDVILIERQRYRTDGTPAILEWTVRVNMFEAMMYACLESLRQEKKWLGRVEGLSPMRILNFWDIEPKPGKTPRPFKMARAESMIDKKEVKLDDGVVNGLVTKGKKDDLADALVQGMAWIRWMENRRKLIEQGWEAIK